VLALLLVALSVGLDNFGASTGIGVFGVDRGLRLRVAVIFGVFEALMPVVGLALGRSVVHTLGSAARPVGGTLLGVAGAYAIVSELAAERTGDRGRPRQEPGVRYLVLLAVALSIDNLVVGFALGTYHVNPVVAAVVIAATSVVLSLSGLEIGRHLGGRLGRRGELVGGVVLVAVGVAVGTGLL